MRVHCSHLVSHHTFPSLLAFAHAVLYLGCPSWHHLYQLGKLLLSLQSPHQHDLLQDTTHSSSANCTQLLTSNPPILPTRRWSPQGQRKPHHFIPPRPAPTHDFLQAMGSWVVSTFWVGLPLFPGGCSHGLFLFPTHPSGCPQSTTSPWKPPLVFPRPGGGR